MKTDEEILKEAKKGIELNSRRNKMKDTFKKQNHSPLKNRQSPLTNPSLDGVSRIDEGTFKLSDKKLHIPIMTTNTDMAVYPEYAIAEFLRRLREADEDIIVYNDYIDKYFPKGDKRRGEVLAILGDIWTRLENNKDNLAGDIK